MSNNPDTPDTPPEVLAAQAKSRPLNAQTAELIGATEYVNDAGKLTGLAAAQAKGAAASAARKARNRAEEFAGGEPIAGIPDARVIEIKGINYPGAPKMDPELGDRTLAFVNWLWANKPEEAKVRYAYRDIWPTSLPATWPPAAKKAKSITKGGIKVVNPDAPMNVELTA
jgi:hypothetical protein